MSLNISLLINSPSYAVDKDSGRDNESRSGEQDPFAGKDLDTLKKALDDVMQSGGIYMREDGPLSGYSLGGATTPNSNNPNQDINTNNTRYSLSNLPDFNEVMETLQNLRLHKKLLAESQAKKEWLPVKETDKITEDLKKAKSIVEQYKLAVNSKAMPRFLEIQLVNELSQVRFAVAVLLTQNLSNRLGAE